MARDSLYQLIQDRMNGGLDDFVKENRRIVTSRPLLSWFQIAAEITTKTGVDINGETVRKWFADSERVSAA